MSYDLVRLECDNLVIGAGIAGLVAALRLKGRTIVAAAGLGATAISGGVLTPSLRSDGVSTPSLRSDGVSTPSLRSDGVSTPLERDEAAEAWFLDTMLQSSCPYRAGRCMTDLMVTREGLVQDITCYRGTPVAISLDGQPAAGTVSVDAPFFRGRSCQEIAHMVESDLGLVDALASSLARVGAESYLLPPVLGVSRAAQARSRLEKALGAEVYEYVTAPSVHGLRLQQALRDLVMKRNNVTLLETTVIDSLRDGARGRMGTKGRRAVWIEASNLVLATGGPLTGLRVDGDRVYEPLTGTVSGDLAADLDPSFASDHRIMCRGIGSRPRADGFRDVRAIGALASGFGLYRALVDGYHAGDAP